MARNGSGTYVLPAGQPVVSGTTISSTVFNTLTSDIGNEITKSVCTDGQTPMTANLPMGNNRITGLAAGISAGDALRLDQVSGVYLPLSGGVLTSDLGMNNNVKLLGKDTGGTLRQLVSYGGDNNVNSLIGTGGYWRYYNSAGAAVVVELANNGDIGTAGDVLFNNVKGIKMRDGGGNLRTIMYVGADSWLNTFNPSAGIRWWNQAASVTIASLDNVGNFSAITVAQTSDERKKCNWKPLTDAQLDAFADMQRVGTFDWIDGNGASVGGSAQEIQAIVPEAVPVNANGDLTVNYGGLNFAILQAMLRRQKAAA